MAFPINFQEHRKVQQKPPCELSGFFFHNIIVSTCSKIWWFFERINKKTN